MKKLILLFLALVLAACSAVPASEFDQNLAKWQSMDVSHYKYTLSIICFCAFWDQMPLTIEVKDDEIVSITNVNGEVIDPSNMNYQYFEEYATIDRIFEALKADIEGEADEVTVSYEPLYGFPVEVSIDRIKEAIDDEVSLQIENFETLQ